MILNVTIPDELQPYLQAAANADGHPDMATAVAAHISNLISNTARISLTNTAMAAVADQVTQGLADVAAQNALIQVTTGA